MRCCPTAPWPDAYLEGTSYAGTEEDTVAVPHRTYSFDREAAILCGCIVAVDKYRALKKQK